MEITRKIRKDLLLLECYAHPNNPRQQAELALSRSLKKARGAIVVHFKFSLNICNITILPVNKITTTLTYL